jgi:hypothetical protein
MIKSFCLLCICLAVAACASQFANRYVGKDVVDLELENGKPTNIVELPTVGVPTNTTGVAGLM